MVHLPLTEEVIERLQQGETVRLSHANLGHAGRNGRLTLDAPPHDDSHALEPRVID